MDLSARTRQRRRRRIEVNIVPMVDVMMTLIFFFLITMQFKQIQAVEIAPPSMSTSEKTSSETPAVIGVDKEGAYYFGGKKTTIEELGAELKKLAAENDSASVIMLADKDVPLHFATSAIDAVRAAKIRKLSIQAETAGK